MMASATTGAAAEAGQEQATPLPLLLLMLDVMQARGRTEAVVRLVDEIYARGDAAGPVSGPIDRREPI